VICIMKAKINKSLMNTLTPGSKDIKVRDTELPGFEMKLTPMGKIVYRVDYRMSDCMTSDIVLRPLASWGIWDYQL